MKNIGLIFSLLLLLSCNAKSEVSSTDSIQQSDEIIEQETTQLISFISGSRQQVFPGMDDGSGRFVEKYILKLDVPRDYAPIIKMEFMGYSIPIDRQITFISDEEKAVLMYEVRYPLMDNYDETDSPAMAIPKLFFKTEGGVVTLDISGCKVLPPVAYPSMNNEGGY
jgi:hypothetical protein